MDIINSRSLSYNSIKDDIINYIFSHKDDVRWKSFLESNAGSIIIELISGLGSYKSYYDLMSERESTLETAITLSSILEHAASRGMLLSPTHSGVLKLELKANEDLVIIKGDQIGKLSDYELYSLESGSFSIGDYFHIKCVIGKKNVFDIDVSGFGNFDTYSFILKDEMAAIEFESLIVENKEIPLQSDLNYLNKDNGIFVLRRTLPGEIRIYAGNGVLGYANLTASKITYKVLSYGKDLESKLSGSLINTDINAAVISNEILSTPDYNLEKEGIRGIARYYPLDGRIVTDQDYVSVIMKYFGGNIHDIYAINTDPNEEIYIIVKDSTTDSDIQEIKDLVDMKRGLGMQVLYFIVRESEGLTMSCDFKIRELEYNEVVENNIKEFMNSQRFKFIRNNKSISTWDYAVELSNYLGITIKALVNNTISLQVMNFIKSFNITLTPVSEEKF